MHIKIALIRLRVRWLAWRYRRITEHRRRLRDKVLSISEEQARLWYKGEVLRCRQTRHVSP